jgi:hypothetical protein
MMSIPEPGDAIGRDGLTGDQRAARPHIESPDVPDVLDLAARYACPLPGPRQVSDPLPGPDLDGPEAEAELELG